MASKKRRLQVGDWFRLPLPDGSDAVGHCVQVAGGGAFMLAYFFYPMDRSQEQGWRSLEPAEALTAVVCGGLGVTTGEWEVIDHTDVDPTAWPVPEFQRRVPTLDGEQLLVVTKQPDLVNDASAAPLKPGEEGLRPPDKLFGYGNVPIWLQHLRNIDLPPVGRQPWWRSKPPATPQSVHVDDPEPDAVLVRIPGTWTGDLKALLTSLEEATSGIGEVDGSLVGNDEITVYIYGEDGPRLGAATRERLRLLDLVTATVEVRTAEER